MVVAKSAKVALLVAAKSAKVALLVATKSTRGVGLLVAAKSTRREWHCTVAARAREVGDEMRESLRGPASGIEAKS